MSLANLISKIILAATIFLAGFFLSSDSSRAMDGALSGYAWSENAGWINFAPPGGGVILDNITNEFRGYAWGENIGWISFNCLDASSCGVVDYKTSIASDFSMGCRSSASYASSCPTCSSSDTTPPVISSIEVSGIASKSAAINWKTNEASDSIIEFSADTSYNFIAGKSADVHTPVFSHQVNLLNLAADTVYHFRVISRDLSGNLAKSNDATFKTSPPTGTETGQDTSVKPTILAEETIVKNLTDSSAAIFWKTDKESNSLVGFKQEGNTKAEWREVGMTGEYGREHLVVLIGLTSDTSYQYQVKSADILGNIAVAKIKTFTTKPAVVISEVTASDITLNSATIAWKTSIPLTSGIDYGLNADYGSYLAKSKDFVSAHEIRLKNLKSGVIYYFRVRGADENDNVIVSDNYVFTTYAMPSILKYSVESVNDSFVILKWTSNIDIDSTVVYTNIKTSETRTQGDTKLTKEHVLKITDLDSGAFYIFKIEGADVFGNKAKGREIKIATLLDGIPPAISMVRTYTTMMQNKDRSQAVITWKTDEPSTSYVILYDMANKSIPVYTSTFDANLTTNHTIVITELAMGVAYRFNIESADKSNNSAVSQDFAILTPTNKKPITDLIMETFQKVFGWMKKMKL